MLGLPRGPLFPERGFVGTAMLTLHPSEFSLLRFSVEGHYRDLVPDGTARNFLVALLQLQVVLGAHGAHQF